MHNITCIFEKMSLSIALSMNEHTYTQKWANIEREEKRTKRALHAIDDLLVRAINTQNFFYRMYTRKLFSPLIAFGFY